MKAGQGVRIAVWAPIAVALGALAGVVINANVGWPIRENMTVIAAGAVAFGGWYAIFSVGLWGVGLLRGDRLARGGIATGLTLGLAAVTSLLMVPPLSLRMALFDYPAVKVAMACDVSFRADPFEEWRCDARKWPQWTEGKQQLIWAGFFDDGRIAVSMALSGPRRRKEGQRYYGTVAMLRPDGGLDQAFADRFHGCLDPEETGGEWKLLAVGNRILFAVGEGKPVRFTIREIIEEDGASTGAKGASEYGRMLEAFGAEQLGVVYDEKGKAHLLALGAGRAGLFDPEGSMARLLRSYPGVAPTRTGNEVEHLPFVVRGEELLAPPECCGEATQPGLCVLRREGPVLRPLQSADLPEWAQFGGLKVTRVEPALAIGEVVVVYLNADGNGHHATMLALLDNHGLLRPELDVSSALNVGGEGRRPLRDGRFAVFSRHAALLIPPQGHGAFLGSAKFAPAEPNAETEVSAQMVDAYDDGKVMAVSADGKVLVGAFGLFALHPSPMKGFIHLHTRGQPARSLALP